MSGLGDRIRSSAMISARPGQFDDLTEIADEVDRLDDEVVRLRAGIEGWISLFRQLEDEGS